MQPKLPRSMALALAASACAVAIFIGANLLRSPVPLPEPTRAPAPQATLAPAPAPAPEAPALTLSQAVGQRIIYSYGGYEPPTRLRELIRRGEAGGVILFKRNVASQQRLARTMRGLQAIRRPKGAEAPLLIMIDQEGGLVKRLPGPPLRSPRQVGRAGSVEAARREGVATGRYLRSCGVNVNLAPLVDVARPGTYQERTSRAYGRDASLVARMGGAFAAGMREQNVVPCFKHFPGMGAAPVDEDLKVNRLDIPRKTLDRVDLMPFKQADEASMVMTSTGLFPSLDKQPALFSPRVVRGELRRKIGFVGLTITDDLEVPALLPYGSATERGRRAILAGNDLLLYCVSLDEGRKALTGLTRLYKQKKLDENELYTTTARVLAFRAKLDASPPRSAAG